MIGSLLDPIVGSVFENSGRVMLGISMIGVAFYYRRALGIAAMIQGAVAYLVAGFVLLGLLVISGIIPTVNVSLALEYGRELLDLSRFARPLLPF